MDKELLRKIKELQKIITIILNEEKKEVEDVLS